MIMVCAKMKHYVILYFLLYSVFFVASDDISITDYVPGIHQNGVKNILMDCFNPLIADVVIASLLDSIDSNAVVISVDNCVVGYSFYSFPYKEPNVGFIDFIGISAQHRKKKYATTLLNFILDRMRNQGMQEVQLVVAQESQSAMNLYYGLGFWNMESDDEYLLKFSKSLVE